MTCQHCCVLFARWVCATGLPDWYSVSGIIERWDYDGFCGADELDDTP